MSDESPFGDFQNDQQHDQTTYADDEPIALPPPGDDIDFGQQQPQHAPEDDDGFGLSSPPLASASGSTAEDTADPFATVDGGSSENAGAFDSFSNHPVEVKEEEAAALQLWEKERAVILRDRASKAEADKQALLSSAKDEVNKFYADREANLAKQQKTNRADEKNYRSDMKATFDSGARWEKVNKLVSTAPRAGEKPGSSRVDRMRKLLIQLKVEKKQ